MHTSKILGWITKYVNDVAAINLYERILFWFLKSTCNASFIIFYSQCFIHRTIMLQRFLEIEAWDSGNMSVTHLDHFYSIPADFIFAIWMLGDNRSKAQWLCFCQSHERPRLHSHIPNLTQSSPSWRDGEEFSSFSLHLSSTVYLKKKKELNASLFD